MKKTLSSYATIAVFFGFLTLLLALSLFLPDAPRSESENRALVQKPVNDLSDLRALTGQYENYVVDQFPYRETLLSLYTRLELAQGKRFVRDTYLTDGDYLLPLCYPVSSQSLQAFTQAIGDAAAAHPEIDFAFAVLPQKSDMLYELASPYLDNRVGERNKQALLAALAKLPTVQCIDVGAYFTETYPLAERSQLYYRTDFHWNAHGAFAAAQYIGGLLVPEGITAPDSEDFVWEEIGGNRTYAGDLNRRFSYRFSTEERIPYYRPENTQKLQYFLSADDAQPVDRTAIIGSGLLQDTLTYGGISTENLGYYRVVNPRAPVERCVVILKDSFQDPTTDYFSELYAQVVVIDPRAYHAPYTFAELLAENDVDLVLFMYHQSNASAELAAFLQ